MISIKVKAPSGNQILELLNRNLVTQGFNNELKQQLIPEIKSHILGGISPVRSMRRFQGYKNPRKYPAGKKPSRPVNLELTGKMLEQYTSEIVNQKSVRLGISQNASGEIKTYAEANNVGTTYVVARRFVPLKGESFNVTIMRMIKDLFAKRISQIINK